MTIQSRSVLPYQCNQALHTWHKDCIPAAWMLAVPGVRESFKIYCVFYGVRRDSLQIFLTYQLVVYSGHWLVEITEN